MGGGTLQFKGNNNFQLEAYQPTEGGGTIQRDSTTKTTTLFDVNETGS